MAKFSLFGGTNPSSVAENDDSVAVLGLGRFGSSVAMELMESGAQVLGIDADADTVQRHNGKLTHVVRADTTDEDVLKELGIPEFPRVVVSIGSDMEASILTASLVVGLGVEHVWAKAVTDPHARILRQLGVAHVVQPERETGRRVAHLVRRSLLDFVEIGTDFALVRSMPSADLTGLPLGEADALGRHQVSVVAVKPAGGRWLPTTPETVLSSDDMIQVVGTVRAVEAFANLR